VCELTVDGAWTARFRYQSISFRLIAISLCAELGLIAIALRPCPIPIAVKAVQKGEPVMNLEPQKTSPLRIWPLQKRCKPTLSKP
jgi:hypothetical protein